MYHYLLRVSRSQDLIQLGAVHPSAHHERPKAKFIVARKAPGFDLGYRYIRLPSDCVDCSNFSFDLFIPDSVVSAALRKAYSPSLARSLKTDLADYVVRPTLIGSDDLACEVLRVESGNPRAESGLTNLRVSKDPVLSRHKVIDLAAFIAIHGGEVNGSCT